MYKELKFDVIVKMKKVGVRLGGVQGGCVQRIEVIVKMPKKVKGAGPGGVRVDVYKDLIEFIVKMQKSRGERGSGWMCTKN